MIAIQLILIVGLLLIGLNFIGSRKSSRTKALKKLLLLLAIPTAILAIMMPSTTTELANLVGVGRGADLLVYGIVVLVIFQAFDGYVKTKEDQKRMAKLVRRVAILEANERNRQ